MQEKMKFFDKFYNPFHGKFLFVWENVPGDDKNKFIEFLTQKFDIDWVKRAKIEKIDSGTIKVYTSQNELSLKLNNKKLKLKIDDGSVDEFSVREKKGTLEIYQNIDLTLIKFSSGIIGIIIFTIIVASFVPSSIESLSYSYSSPFPESYIANGTSSQYILSALAQSQAAIIAIVFTALLIVSQTTIGLDPKRINLDIFNYKIAIILIILYAYSIGYDLILLTLIKDGNTKINVFAPILLMVFLIIILIPSIVVMVRWMHKKVLAGKARIGEHKYLVGLDLSDTFLAEAKLAKADLTRANLKKSKLQKADLKDATMVKTKLNEADLNEAYLSGADLMGADMSNCDLSSVDLRGSRLLKARLVESEIDHINFSGADLSKAEIHTYFSSWDKISKKDGTELKKFLKQKFGLDYVSKKINDYEMGIDTKNPLSLFHNDGKVDLKMDDNIIYEFIPKTENDKLALYESNTIKNCNLSGAKMSNVNVPGIKFVKCELNGVKFDSTVYLFSWDKIQSNDYEELKEFIKQELDKFCEKITPNEEKDCYKIEIRGAEKPLLMKLNNEKTKVCLDIDGVPIYELIVKPENEKLNLYKNIRSNLKYADLKNIKLNGANLKYTDLTGADLSGATLNGADLSFTILENAKLEGTKMIGAKIYGAVFDPDFKGNFEKYAELGLSEKGIYEEDYLDSKLGEVDWKGQDLSNSYKEPQFLFNWDEIPGNYCQLLIFLENKYKINLTSIASIKLESMAIDISGDHRHIVLTFDEDQLKVELEIDGVILDEFFVIEENSSRNVYANFDYHASHLNDTKLNGANLTESKLSGCVLENSKLKGTILKKAELNGANMKGACLMDANLVETELNGADLSSTTLGGANLCGAYLNGAILDGAIMCCDGAGDSVTLSAFKLGDNNCPHNPNLKCANLRKAKLNGASLKNANLMGVDLSEATLSGANLERADLRGADLRGTDFCGAELKNADFRDTIWDDKTYFGGAAAPPNLSIKQIKKSS